MGAKTWQKYHYNQKAVTTEIKAESSATVVVNINGKDCYYKVTYGETRLVPHDANMEKEKAILFDDINEQVDNQILEIYNAYQKK